MPWAADALVPCILIAIAAIVLTLHDEHVIVFYDKGFNPPVPTQIWEMEGNLNIFLYSRK